MRAAFSKTEIESEITSRFGSAFKLHEKRPAEVISTGLREVDSFIGGGLPRGSITEVIGPASSGRTSFMLSALAHATERQEVCALVDTTNAFDPQSASQAEINFERLLWIRCANHLEHAFKSTDLLLQGGGFGLIVLDLGDVAAKDARRVISSWWYRFRRTLEATPTALLVIAEESCVRSCASLALELKQETWLWSSNPETLKVSEFTTTPSGLLACGPQRSLRKDSRAPFSFGSVNSGRMNLIPLPHANLMRGLHFRVNCQRPLYLQQRIEMLVKASF